VFSTFKYDERAIILYGSDQMNLRYVLLAIAVAAFIMLPAFAADTATDPMTAAGKLYSDSVDLANTGNYLAALDDADQALAMNVTSLVPLIQSNRAGILVMLGRYGEAIAAADVTIGTEGNLTSAKSIAWFNKGNALKELGRIDEARNAYAQAAALDPTLPVPDLPAGTTATIPVSVPATVASLPTGTPAVPASPTVTAGTIHPSATTTTKTPLSALAGVGAVMGVVVCVGYGRK
jgi:tetratricopeptide (TPR) repeat protein